MNRLSSNRLEFGPKEWIAGAALLLAIVGAWVDMRVQSAVGNEKLGSIERTIERTSADVESRLRALERPAKVSALP